MAFDVQTLTDLAINIGHPNKSIAFPGPVPVEGSELEELCVELAKVCSEKYSTREEFTHEHRDLYFRGHWDRAVVDGDWIRLRKQPKVPPSLDTLPTDMPQEIKKVLLSEELLQGGLILVLGKPGQGKTTTASATVVSLLHQYGGMAYTVEDPFEHPLNGWHGGGYCAQTIVKNADTDSEAWGKALKSALRSQPAKTNSILFIGEIREKEAAVIALQAAAMGFLVIATAFGADIASGIDDFAKKVGEENYPIFGSRLRVALHMKLIGGIPQFSIMVCPENSEISMALRVGRFTAIESELQFQRNALILKRDLWRSDKKLVA